MGTLLGGEVGTDFRGLSGHMPSGVVELLSLCVDEFSGGVAVVLGKVLAWLAWWGYPLGIVIETVSRCRLEAIWVDL